MSFLDELRDWPVERVRQMIDSAQPADVERALAREVREPRDLAALLSRAAVPRLEAIAREAQRLTRWHFGRTISMYAPIYLSNICAADCSYCGYAARSGSKERRRTLSEAELRQECEALRAHGYLSVLLLTGEAPQAVGSAQIAEAVRVAHEYFPSVAVEVYSLEEDEYREMVRRGLDGVTLYMETYHEPTYEQVHVQGIKRDYLYRLNTTERAGRAGVRRLSIGALLGLYDWQVDGFWTALHARRLQRVCWQSAVSVSVPRLRHTPARFAVPHLVSDRELVQLIVAMRLFVPEAGVNLSTREPAALRDALVPLGVTHMSAGSSTRPGGYSVSGEETLEQFEVEDQRSPAEVAAMIRRAGYDPVWKDFDHAFDATAKR
jgi:2-iminoacetate synthase